MFRSIVVLGTILVIAIFSATAMATTTIKLGHVGPASWQSSKKGAAGVIFKNIVEGESDISVELFPAKALVMKIVWCWTVTFTRICFSRANEDAG